jgi:Tfp pilus assembly PilM family ATPase
MYRTSWHQIFQSLETGGLIAKVVDVEAFALENAVGSVTARAIVSPTAATSTSTHAQ